MYVLQDDPDIAAIDYVVLDEVHGKYGGLWCGVVWCSVVLSSVVCTVVWMSVVWCGVVWSSCACMVVLILCTYMHVCAYLFIFEWCSMTVMDCIICSTVMHAYQPHSQLLMLFYCPLTVPQRED